MRLLISSFFAAFSFMAAAQNASPRNRINQSADKIEQTVIEWRRDFHAHPELGTHEVRTA